MGAENFSQDSCGNVSLPLRPRKVWGQNFLRCSHIAENIVQDLKNHGQGDGLLYEVGPGLGHLTRVLLRAGCCVHGFEIDRRCEDALQALHLEYPAMFTYEFQDILRVQSLPSVGGCVANLPYNIATTLVWEWVKHRLFPFMTVMMQQEVVNRLCAPCGSKSYGQLSVMIQWQAQVRLVLGHIQPSCFMPQPAVHSAVVSLVPYDQQDAEQPSWSQMERVVKTAFSQRRKQIRTSLKPLFTVHELEGLGINPVLRAEDISVQNYKTLALRVKDD